MLPLLLGICACGRTLGDPYPESGKAPATTGGAAGGEMAGGSGTGGQQGSAGGAGQAFSGAGGVARFDPCGTPQDLVGNWVSVNAAHAEPTPGHVDECFNLLLTGSGATLRAYTWVPPPPRHSSYVELDTNGGVVGDGSFLIRDVFEGPVEVDYLGACLMTDGGAVGCERLTQVLIDRGAADETYDQVGCVAQGDRCRCTFQVSYTKYMGGFYLFEPTVGELSFVNINAGNGTAECSYCVGEAGLRFGFGFERLSPFGLGLLYTKVDCQDRVQSPAETGVDCGLACNEPCP